jgi:hypothetical protein
MMPITAATLREVCSPPLEGLQPRQAFRACRSLGRLARWWLRPEVLRLAQRHDPSYPEWTNPERPPLPEKLGDCSVIFRTKAGLPLFRPAFLMPLCWQPAPDHSPLLPPELIALAEQVVADVRQELGRSSDWGLYPADGLDLERNPVGEGLGLPCESGWAALAAGLIARAEGLLPSGRVWASGAWNRYGLADIDGLEAKLELAVEWEAADFFVPVWLRGKAREWVEGHAPARLRIGALAAPVEPKPRRALNEYLARFTAQPPIPQAGSPQEEDQFQGCRHYFLHQPAFTDSTRAFYWSHLLPGIIRRLREKVRQDRPGLCVTHFATVVSPSHELAVLAPLAVGAKSCLLLHTPDERMTGLAEECRQYLAGEAVDCRLQPIDPGDKMEGSFRRGVDEFTRGVPPERVILDLKPGTKKMTYAQSRVARPGNWLFNLEAKFLDDRRTDPGTEQPELWQAGA